MHETNAAAERRLPRVFMLNAATFADLYVPHVVSKPF